MKLICIRPPGDIHPREFLVYGNGLWLWVTPWEIKLNIMNAVYGMPCHKKKQLYVPRVTWIDFKGTVLVCKTSKQAARNT